MSGLTGREALAAREREVLDALLAGSTPPGFDAVGTALTTRVLHHKRSSAALRAAPELELLDRWRDRFHAWAADHPQHGCVHDDVAAFVDHLRSDAGARGWVRVHEVYAGRSRAASARPAGRWMVVLAVGRSVWRIHGRPRRQET